MTHPQDGNELLMSGGIKSAGFQILGDTVVGTIIDQPKQVQMTKYKSDELDYWPSGDPKMQIVVTIQTDERDPADPTDDGRRRLFITPRMMKPTREAVLRAGVKGLAIGGRLAERWVSGSGEGAGNAREFAAEYAPPVVDPGSLLGPATAPPILTPALVAAPVAAAPITAPFTGMLGPTAQTAAPMGVDPNVWAGLPEAQRQAILAAMSNPAATAAPF